MYLVFQEMMMRYLLAMMLALAACSGTESSGQTKAAGLAADTIEQELATVRAFAIYDKPSPGMFKIVCSGPIAITQDGGNAGGTWTCSHTRDSTTGALVGAQSGTITGTISGDNLSLVLSGGPSEIQVAAHVVTTGTLHRLDGTAEVAGASHSFQAWDGQDVLH
jgi:hypothetical protein